MGEPGSMPPTESPAKLTFEDYLLFPADGQRHELIDGEHIVSPSPMMRHQRIVRRLLVSIARYLEANPVGEVFAAPFTTILSSFDVVEPDLLYVSHERRHVLEQEDWVRGAPDLVIEILSPSSRKLGEVTKRKLYERSGVDEYWIADPELDLVKVYRRQGGRFVRAAECTREESGVLSTPLLPGLEIALEKLFA
jgi:Uma2 family endonuclease